MLTTSLAFADSRELDAPFAHQLQTGGPRSAFIWLTEVLALQKPRLRSSNSFLVAYTGCVEAIEWIEMTVTSPVTEHWGNAAALLGTPWPRLATWLSAPSPTQLVALDALVAYRSPAPNMSPLAQIAAPVLPDAPSPAELETVLDATLQTRSTPRVRDAVDTIRYHSSEILRDSSRGVAVEDLPRLYLDPESFAHAGEMLARADSVSRSIDDLLGKLKSN